MPPRTFFEGFDRRYCTSGIPALLAGAGENWGTAGGELHPGRNVCLPASTPPEVEAPCSSVTWGFPRGAGRETGHGVGVITRGDGLRVQNFVSGVPPEPSRQKEGAEARNACVPTTVWVGAPPCGDRQALVMVL